MIKGCVDIDVYTYLISASSRTPPNEIRWNSLDIDCAMDFPSEVLPTPGYIM